MLGSDEPQRITSLTEALEKNVFNASFGIRGKKQTQIALIHTLTETGVLDFSKPVEPDLALRLGMDPTAFSRLVYDAFLNLADRDPDALSVSYEELREWNATTDRDVKRGELRFEVPTHIARARLQSYLSSKGIQPEDGRNRLILKVQIERLLSRLPDSDQWLDEAITLLDADAPDEAREVEAEPTTREKLLRILMGSSEFIVKTAVAAAIDRGINAM